jgi:hypothetical protein
VHASLEPSPWDPFPDEDVVNLVRPDDAFGATPRWTVLDQEPVSRFEAGDLR